MKLKAIWSLMRLEHGLMLALAIFIGSIVTSHTFFRSWVGLIYAFLTALLLEASTFSLNDYLDIEIDKKNNRSDRPLVRGDLKPKTAILIFSILFPLGIFFSYLINSVCFYIAILTGFLAILYDFKLKKLKYLGNLYIAYTTSIPFIFGSLVVSSKLPNTVVVLATISFIASWGREIMKDIMDIEGDKAEGVRSIPISVGVRVSSIIVSMLYISAVILSFVPFFILIKTSFYWNYPYLITVVFADILFLYISIDVLFRDHKDLSLYRRISLIGMFIGLIAFLVGSFYIGVHTPNF